MNHACFLLQQLNTDRQRDISNIERDVVIPLLADHSEFFASPAVSVDTISQAQVLFEFLHASCIEICG